jgi:hypothetical protein
VNRTAILAALVAAAAFTATPVTGQLAGTWEVTTQGGRGGPQTSTLVLVQDGETLTGTMMFNLPEQAGGPQELEVSNGTVDGNSFSFTVTLSLQGNSITLNYSGAVDGDEMSGTRGGPRGGGQSFTGQRQV